MDVSEYVWVKLTPSGKEHLRRYYADRGLTSRKYMRTKKGLAGSTRFQMWDLMLVFGPLFGTGRPGPFQNCELYFSEPSN